MKYLLIVLLLFGCYSNKLSVKKNIKPKKAVWIMPDRDVFNEMTYEGFDAIYLFYMGDKYKSNFDKAVNLALKDSIDIYVVIMVNDSGITEQHLKTTLRTIEKFCKENFVKGIILDYIRFKDIEIFGKEVAERKDYIDDFVLSASWTIKYYLKDFYITMIGFCEGMYGQDRDFFISIADKVLPMYYPEDTPIPFKWFINGALKECHLYNFEPCLQGYGNMSYKKLQEQIGLCNKCGYSIFRLKTYMEIKK